MDFFDQQEQARRKTSQLILLFTLAIGALIAGAYIIARGLITWIYGTEARVFSYAYVEARTEERSWWGLLWQWDTELFWWVTLGTLSVVIVGSMYKTLQLRAGGAAVALSLGARLLNHSTKDPQERQALNVVEEMAIASGTPTPPVYLLDHEPGINAFAAGYSSDDAVIGITRGSIELLSREELQGVVAHEFSHILNGDMRLNISLMGLVHGILVIGLSGQILLRGSSRTSSGIRVRRHSGKEGLAVMLLGLSLIVLGYTGVFFANLIKAAVSRQREFLADASAIQFTRHPAGLLGALKKIGGHEHGSLVLDPRSQTVSHMYFNQGFSESLGNLFATHPPLIKRIRRIEPRFSGTFPEVMGADPSDTIATLATLEPAAMPTLAQTSQAVGSPPVSSEVPPDPVAEIGHPTAAHLSYARNLLDRLPRKVLDAAHAPYGARALIYALLLHRNSDSRHAQLSRLSSHADVPVYQETLVLAPFVDRLAPAARLPLIDITIPTLSLLSSKQYSLFKTNILALIQADKTTELFEWMLQRVLLRHLEPTFRPVKKPIVRYHSLKPLGEHCSALLSGLAHQGNTSPEQAQSAFERGVRHLNVPGLRLRPYDRSSLPVIDYSLDVLAQASPPEKRKILQACTGCILGDKQITVQEAELLRAIADSLGCPMPPLLAGQPAQDTAPLTLFLTCPLTPDAQRSVS